MKNVEFSKKLLVLDYTILIALIVLAAIKPEIDFATVIVAWVAQLGVSTAVYYWKSKCENRTKIPFRVIETLPDNLKQELNLTDVIVAIITSE